jgi:membrane-associated phospholipid phosphatase
MSISETTAFRSTLRLMLATTVATLLVALFKGFSFELDAKFLAVVLFLVLSAAAWQVGTRRGLVRAGLILQSIAFFIGVPSLLVVMSYVLAAANFPLVDAELARLDRLVGFDWTAHLLAVWSVPSLGKTLEFAYHATGQTLFITLGILIILGRTRQVAELWYLMVAAGVGCMSLATLLPAEGAFVFHAPDLRLTPLAAPDNGIWHLVDFRAVRAGELRYMDIGVMQGIVTFPSYHTAMAMIFAHALRGTIFFVPAALFSLLVILSTLAIGGHYLVDVAAGAAMTFAMMAALRRGAAEESVPLAAATPGLKQAT